jgi:hypothetical protein
MAIPPYDFDKLAVPKGAPLRTVLSARWYAALARTLKAICPVAVENSGLAVTYTPAGAFLWTTRPIPALIYAKADGSGITARHATTGAWGSGTATLYHSDVDGTDHFEVLGDAEVTVYNRRRFSAPGNSELLIYGEGGYYFLLSVECP